MIFYIGMLIGALVYGLVFFLISKYWRLPVIAFFWLLGWNDRRRAKAYKKRQPLGSFEVQGGRLEIFAGRARRPEGWCRHGIRLAEHCEDCVKSFETSVPFAKGENATDALKNFKAALNDQKFKECQHGVTKGNCFICDDY